MWIVFVTMNHGVLKLFLRVGLVRETIIFNVVIIYINLICPRFHDRLFESFVSRYITFICLQPKLIYYGAQVTTEVSNCVPYNNVWGPIKPVLLLGMSSSDWPMKALSLQYVIVACIYTYICRYIAISELKRRPTFNIPLAGLGEQLNNVLERFYFSKSNALEEWRICVKNYERPWQ